MLIHSILIIDDELEVRTLLKEFLGRHFPTTRVIEAKDGHDGLRKIENQKFKIIISDLKMPKASGTDVIKIIAERFQNHKPDKIFVLTGAMSDEQVKKLNAANPKSLVQFWSKPYDEDEFSAAIGEYLRA